MRKINTIKAEGMMEGQKDSKAQPKTTPRLLKETPHQSRSIRSREDPKRLKQAPFQKQRAPPKHSNLCKPVQRAVRGRVNLFTL